MKSAPSILHLGLDVHKETIAVAIASGDGSVRRYGQIPGHLQAVDTLLKKLQKPYQRPKLSDGREPSMSFDKHNKRERLSPVRCSAC